MVFMSNVNFDFDLFDLMRTTSTVNSSCWDGQLLNQTVPMLDAFFSIFSPVTDNLLFLNQRKTEIISHERMCRARGSIVGPACEAYTQPTELPRPVSDMNSMIFGLGLYMKGVQSFQPHTRNRNIEEAPSINTHTRTHVRTHARTEMINGYCHLKHSNTANFSIKLRTLC